MPGQGTPRPCRLDVRHVCDPGARRPRIGQLRVSGLFPLPAPCNSSVFPLPGHALKKRYSTADATLAAGIAAASLCFLYSLLDYVVVATRQVGQTQLSRRLAFSFPTASQGTGAARKLPRRFLRPLKGHELAPGGGKRISRVNGCARAEYRQRAHNLGPTPQTLRPAGAGRHHLDPRAGTPVGRPWRVGANA